MENTWGLKFVKIDEANNIFIDLFGVNCGTKQNAKEQFEKIKRIFPMSNDDIHECVVDLVDENDDIYDDYGLSYEQAIAASKMFRLKIKMENELEIV